MKTTTQKISLSAMGIALFVVFTLCLQVPVFENYYLCLGYVVMAIYCYSFGALYGTATGFFGVLLYCFLTNGLRGMPGWALGNVVIGVALGISFRLTKPCKNNVIKAMIHSVVIVVSTAVAMLVVKSTVECFLYGQSFFIRTIRNVYAFVADVFILLFSLPICYKLDPVIHKILK